MQRYLVLLAVGKHLLHGPVVAGECYQLVHAVLNVVASHQFVQFFARVVNRRQHLYIHAQSQVLVYRFALLRRCFRLLFRWLFRDRHRWG